MDGSSQRKIEQRTVVPIVLIEWERDDRTDALLSLASPTAYRDPR